MIKKFNQDYVFCVSEESEIKNKFYERNKTEEELEKENLLRIKIDGYVKKVYGDKLSREEFEKSLCDGYSYLEGYGYYYLVHANRDFIDIYSLGDDLEDAFKTFIVDNECYRAIDEEHINRNNKFEDDYVHRFRGLKYLSCLYFAELPLKKWGSFYEGNIPEDVITHYVNYLNGLPLSEEENLEWQFSNENPNFTCQKRENVKTLIKK